MTPHCSENGFGDYEEVWDRNPSLPPLHDRYIGRNEKSAAEILAPAALVKPVNPSHQRAPFGYDPLWVYKKFTRFQEPQYNRFNNDLKNECKRVSEGKVNKKSRFAANVSESPIHKPYFCGSVRAACGPRAARRVRTRRFRPRDACACG